MTAKIGTPLTVLVLISLLVIAGAAQPAAAHSVSLYIPWKWSTAGENTIDWYFKSDFPGGSHRDRVLNGASQWNQRGGAAEPNFINAGQRTNPGNADNPCGNSLNGAFWRNLDLYGPSVLGVAIVCVDGFGNITRFTINFDSDQNWYTGTGDADDGFLNLCPFGTCEKDLWSVASHEWGHIAGFLRGPNDDGHYDSGDPVCENNSSQHTMCPVYSPGTERMRSLETHDIHTFEAAY
ncbi:MAG: hypothetical protein ACRDT4_22020 [Micromonosporaceae bacterium]